MSFTSRSITKTAFIMLILAFLLCFSSCVREYPDETFEPYNTTGERELLNSIDQNGFMFNLYSDRTADCVGIKDEHTFNYYSEIKIPEKINGYKLVRIEDELFKNSDFTNINIPETVEYLGDRCFQQSKIAKINIPSSVKYLGEEIFDNCYDLKEIDFKANIEEIKVGSFFSCNQLEKISLPEGIKIIREDAFAQCSLLKEVIFPDSLETIEQYAFYNCPMLKPEIPSGVLIAENNFN